MTMTTNSKTKTTARAVTAQQNPNANRLSVLFHRAPEVSGAVETFGVSAVLLSPQSPIQEATTAQRAEGVGVARPCSGCTGPCVCPARLTCAVDPTQVGGGHGAQLMKPCRPCLETAVEIAMLETAIALESSSLRCFFAMLRQQRERSSGTNAGSQESLTETCCACIVTGRGWW